MKVRGIVALSVVAALAVVAVACGGADAEVRVDKGLAAYAGANAGAVQQNAGESARSTASTSSASQATDAGYKQSLASAPAVSSGGLGASPLTRDATSSSGAALAPLEQVGPLGIVVQGYGRATASADTARVGFLVGKSGVVYPEPMPLEPGVMPEGGVQSGSAEGEIAPTKPDVYATPVPPEPITEADLQPLLDAIKAQGVSDSDIEVTIYPSTYYGPYGTPTARVTVTLRDVSKVGTLIDAGNQAVADSGTLYIQNVGVTYSVDNCDGLLAQARAAAVEDARDNGTGLAEALGVGLGGIQGATEYNWDPYGYSGCQSQSGGPVPYYEGPSYDPSVPAEVQIVSNVTISFAMQ